MFFNNKKKGGDCSINEKEGGHSVKFCNRKPDLPTTYSYVKEIFHKLPSKQIILSGPFCCGKTVIGKRLAKEHGIAFLDLDAVADSRFYVGHDFREREHFALKRLMKQLKGPFILKGPRY